MTKKKTREDRLRELVEIHHRDRYGDYEDSYEEFAATYLPLDDDAICDECGEEKRAKVHTDTELHPDDKADGLELHAFKAQDDDDGEREPIPRYASIASDETYGMIHLFDALTEALADQADIPDNGEYLNVPTGIVDLDTGKQIKTRSVVLTEDAYAMVCGLVGPSETADSAEGIWKQGIFGPFEEVQTAFPTEVFWKAVKGKTEDDDLYYDEEAGL